MQNGQKRSLTLKENISKSVVAQDLKYYYRNSRAGFCYFVTLVPPEKCKLRSTDINLK